MNFSIADLATFTGCSAATLIIVQLAKTKVPDNWIAVFSAVTGMIVAVLATWIIGKFTQVEVGNALVVGLFSGASASGIYDGIRGLAPKVLTSASDQRRGEPAVKVG